MESIVFNIIDGVKIYGGITVDDIDRYTKSCERLTQTNKLFDTPQPSTLTAQGLMSNISFEEEQVFSMLPEPTGNIMLIGCNYGKKINPLYKPVIVEKKSGRGRKPKPKEKTKRRSQGTGEYFSSQITFVVAHEDLGTFYKIKLFRNGVFQVPGIKNPSMSDLIKPIKCLQEYLTIAFVENVEVINFTAVMRNYKAKLLDAKYYVDLIDLERKIAMEKSVVKFERYLETRLSHLTQTQQINARKFIGKTNSYNIAEINYNTDKCFCLTLKFYRPMPYDLDKKTTVKLLKKGKINFDGGNSELEMLELYNWLEHCYNKYHDDILVDYSSILNEYISDYSNAIYD